MLAFRVVIVLGLLVAIWYGYRLALVLLLGWYAVQLVNVRQELFYRQEDDAMRRLKNYWDQLTGRQT
jgi:hypothetical protein